MLSVLHLLKTSGQEQELTHQLLNASRRWLEGADMEIYLGRWFRGEWGGGALDFAPQIDELWGGIQKDSQDRAAGHPSDHTLVEAIAEVLQGPYGRNRLSGETLKFLRRAVLLPGERNGLLDRLVRKEIGCARCGHTFASGEAASCIIEREGPIFLCTGCFTPEKGACKGAHFGEEPCPNTYRIKNFPRTFCEEHKRQQREAEGRGAANQRPEPAPPEPAVGEAQGEAQAPRPDIFANVLRRAAGRPPRVQVIPHNWGDPVMPRPEEPRPARIADLDLDAEFPGGDR